MSSMGGRSAMHAFSTWSVGFGVEREREEGVL